MPLTMEQPAACRCASEGGGRVADQCATSENYFSVGKSRSTAESRPHLDHIDAGRPCFCLVSRALAAIVAGEDRSGAEVGVALVNIDHGGGHVTADFDTRCGELYAPAGEVLPPGDGARNLGPVCGDSLDELDPFAGSRERFDGIVEWLGSELADRLETSCVNPLCGKDLLDAGVVWKSASVCGGRGAGGSPHRNRGHIPRSPLANPLTQMARRRAKARSESPPGGPSERKRKRACPYGRPPQEPSCG